MRYTVIIEPITDTPGMKPGWFYARIPAFDLVTQGEGVDQARAAAQELVELWIEGLREDGKPVPEETDLIVTSVNVGGAGDAVQAA